MKRVAVDVFAGALLVALYLVALTGGDILRGHP
jgi:hypothetical protein